MRLLASGVWRGPRRGDWCLQEKENPSEPFNSALSNAAPAGTDWLLKMQSWLHQSSTEKLAMAPWMKSQIPRRQSPLTTLISPATLSWFCHGSHCQILLTLFPLPEPHPCLHLAHHPYPEPITMQAKHNCLCKLFFPVHPACCLPCQSQFSWRHTCTTVRIVHQSSSLDFKFL